MFRTAVLAGILALGFAAAPAAAYSTFYTDFDDITLEGDEQIFADAQGWTAGPGGVRIQTGGIHGDPYSPANLVELDTGANSFMQRTIDAGVYRLIFAYSPRPGNNEDSNGIGVYFNGELLTVTQSGENLNNTDWTDIEVLFTAASSGSLRFASLGDADSMGGYLDDIELQGSPLPAVPEPGEWAMLAAGLGVIGMVARRRRAA